MTLSEIEKVLEKRAVIAVNHATELIMKDMSEAIADYYGDYPNPKRYNRTGLLKSTPKVFKAPAFSGNSATAEIGLNTDLQYHTGTWSMSNVISSAENNLHGGYALVATLLVVVCEFGLFLTIEWGGDSMRVVRLRDFS